MGSGYEYFSAIMIVEIIDLIKLFYKYFFITYIHLGNYPFATKKEKFVLGTANLRRNKKGTIFTTTHLPQIYLLVYICTMILHDNNNYFPDLYVFTHRC